MAKGKNRNNKGGQGAVVIKHVEMEGRSIAVMVESGTQAANVASNAGSIDLYESEGEDFEEESVLEAAALDVHRVPPGVRLNASVNTGKTQCEPSAAAEKREAAEEGRIAGRAQKKTTSFAGLFTGNRMPSEGSKLELFNQDDEPAVIELEDIQESDFLWERCLVGYFGGRFPGKQALRLITNSWKVQVTVKHHGSGWLVFQFSSEDDKANVLGNGPYIIYGRPLLLKAMPRLFKFGNEAITSFPVWVQIRYIPLDMWCPKVFGIICSKIGKPIHMDKLTTKKERITYGRCLIEIDMTKEIKHTVKVNLNFPGGGIYDQPIFYENLPRFCTHCRTRGHTQEGCKANKANSNKNVATKPTEVVTEEGKETEAAATETNVQTGPSGAGTNKGNQLEWITKQPKPSKGQKGRLEAVKNLMPVTCNKFSPLEINQENEECIITNAEHSKEDQVEWAKKKERNAKGHIEDTVASLDTEIPIPITNSSSKQSQSTPIQAPEIGETIIGHEKAETATAPSEAATASRSAAAAASRSAAAPQRKMVQSGGAAIQKRNPVQPIRRSITGTLTTKNLYKPQPLSTSNPLAKGDEGMGTRDKKATGKNGKATPLANFCAEMGEDSPTPTN